MDWRKGFSASYYAMVVDPVTWKDTERIDIIGGSISHKESDLRVSGDIDCVRFDYGETWVRVYLDAFQGQDSAHVPLITGLTCCPDDDFDGFYRTNAVEIYSVLKPCEDVLLPRGYYVPAGQVGADAIKDLLKVSPAPIVIEGDSPRLQSNIVAENGENHLTMIEKILLAINWRMTLRGDGTIVLSPKSDEPVTSIDTVENDILEPKIKRSKDWYSCPNVFRAIIDSITAIARDDDPDSPYSTVSRGREIWEEDDNCDLNDRESPSEYAHRRLKEAQNVTETITYDRRFLPDADVTDCITLNLSGLGITGKYRIRSQSIELTHGARTSEEVVRV
mgnify:CR=1 FL=1